MAQEGDKAEKEVKTIMGGKVLEFRADKYYDAGKAEGMEKGIEKGIEKGEHKIKPDVQFS